MVESLTGPQAESLACAHLEHAGLRLVTRNYRCPRGEIDLIMDDHGTLVFVEVRYRRVTTFGQPAETVDRRKRTRLQATAEHYLLAQRTDRACRFDVVAIHGDRSPRIEWVRDAFRAEP